MEPGEDRLSALRRELREEAGSAAAIDPPHLWRQVVVAADHAPGFDGIVSVRAASPSGAFWWLAERGATCRTM